MIQNLIKYCLLILILMSGISFAQKTSTYTRYGVGDIYYSYSARTLSMGHTGTAMINSDYVEILNPASWSSLSRVRLEMSFAYDELKLSNANDTKYYGDGLFKGVTFGFPISEVNKISLAFGVVPYSRINYEVTENVIDTLAGNYNSTYLGKGGLSKIFIGSSFQLPGEFLIGATLEYYFGNIKYTSKLAFENTTYFPSEYELNFAPKGFGTTIGLITPDLSGLLKSDAISNLRLGLSTNIVGKLNTDSSFVSRSSSIVDSISTGETKMEVPMRLNAGLHITFVNVYNLALDYFYQPWTEFKLSKINQSNLSDVHRISLGFEYRPQRVPGVTFWEQIMFRAGLSYEMSQYNFNGNELKQYSVFGGFALPLSPENTVDLGFEYSVRGTKEDNLLEENFLRINFGISFGDIWFIRYDK
ncbi:MAG: hypothetical protein IH618_08950 [Ignavibacteriaceae bacterium]|nr:hypothetical protein [Ignavibacteriaceae bacterium]